MPTTMPEGIRVPAGGDNYDLTNDLRKMMESATTIVPVANIPARTALVAALAAAGRPPSTSDPLYVDRADAATADRLEVTHNGTTWGTVPALSSTAIPMIGIWAASNLVATNVGPLLMVTGTVATTNNTVPAGTTLAVGVIPAGWRPSTPAHASLSGQILGSSQVYSARGSLVIETSGNISIFTDMLTTTCYVSLVCVR